MSTRPRYNDMISKQFMDNLLRRHKPYWQDKKFIVSLGVGVLFLILGIIATFLAIVYATDHSSYPVTDIILSNTPVFDVDGIFIYGPIIFWVLISSYILIFEPKKIPFTLKSIALFLIIRSIFISLTHIGPFPTHIQINSSGILSMFTSGTDLFFSGHTGMPFLMALLLWDNKYLRIFSITASILFGVVVLLAHLHYSIDVFSAFFITYAIYRISEKLFKKDRQIFINGLQTLSIERRS